MRVITYSDPRQIEEIKEWDMIRKIPQLCVSQTLVQGLARKCSRDSFSILTTIEKFLNYFYEEWKNDSELSIKQFVELSDEIRKIQDKKLKSTFLRNRSEVYKSIKLLKESDIVPSDLAEEIKSKEFGEFREIYKNICFRPNWNILSYSDDKDKEFLKLCYKKILIADIVEELESLGLIAKGKYKDVIDEEELLSKLANYKFVYNKKNSLVRRDGRSNDEISINRIKTSANLIKDLDKLDLRYIVIHGVHQFTPLILRFIKQLEKIGVEVIFLINYNPEFEEVYSTWKKVYRWTDCDFEINRITSKAYAGDEAKDYAKILIGDMESLSNKVYECEVYDNLTEYGNYVAKVYEDASKKSRKKETVPVNSSKVLYNMDEQFYSVNGEEINNLLSVYFPEQFGERHFLSYPIGQFILGLYDMWDFKEGKLKISDNALKECLAVNLWGNEKIVPISLYENLRGYFIGVEDYDIYLKLIGDLKLYSTNLRKDKYRGQFNDYKLLSFFKVEPEDVEYYEYIINDIKNVAEKLFKGKERVDLKTHYKELMEILKERISISKNISETELNFVNEIFDNLSMGEESINSSVNEIKDTLHFYLAQKKEKNNSNWIVRDFEQIDGGVFLADEKAKETPIPEKKSIYHYAEVSDNNMISSKKKELPWPLKDEYFLCDNKVISIVLECKNEYSNFLKYTLFYGMYYLDREYKISYIKNISNEEEETLFFPLRLLGVEEKQYIDNYGIDIEEKKKDSREVTQVINDKEIKIRDARMFEFCKRRFYYEGLIDNYGVYKTDYLCKQYLKTLLSIRVRRDVLQGKELDYVLETRIDKGKNLIKSWNREFADIKSYILTDVKRNKNEKNIDYNYFEIKKEFLSKRFTSKENGRKEYVSDFKNKQQLEITKNKIIDYIRSDKEEYYSNDVLKEKCDYCKYKEICTYNNSKERG